MNTFTEGIHHKSKVIRSISFGVRNFNRFRNRILYL
ncbi:MAG: transposase, partial [Acidaminococcaceae bacterium]